MNFAGIFKSFLLVAATIVGLTANFAEAQLRIVTYNASSDNNPPSSLNSSSNPLAGILSAIGSETTNGVSKPLDVLLLQEQSTNLTSTATISALLNNIYGAGSYSYVNVAGGSTGAGTQTLIYNTHTIQSINTATDVAKIGTTSTTGQPRQAMRFKLTPVGYDSSASFYIYDSHYKADSDSTSQGRRNAEAIAIRADADALGPGASIIYAGDFNIYNSTEAMWTTLTAAGNGQALDPINRVGHWDNTASFADVDTQSPIANSNPNYPYYSGQVGGGLDDRFDFQLVSSALKDGHGMSYLTGSYHTFGNNGPTKHPFNGSIDDIANNDDPNSSTVLTDLAEMSDHLPVVAQYQLPAKMNTIPMYASQVIVGAATNAQVKVTNSAGDGTLVKTAAGADSLSYSISTSGAVSGTASGSGLMAFDTTGNTHNFTMNTASAGLKSGTITVSATSAQVPNAIQNDPVSYSVLDHANASFSGSSDSNSMTINFGRVGQSSGAHDAAFNVYNLLATAGFTAGLDLTSITPSGSAASLAALGTNLSTFSNLSAGSYSVFDADLNTNSLGTFSATYTLGVSDTALPGATANTSLTLTLTGIVNPFAPGDFNLDHHVDAADIAPMLLALTDLSAYESQYGATPTDVSYVGDVNGDGAMTNADLQYLENELISGQGNNSAVPEPSAFVLLGFASLILLHRCRRGC